MIIIYYCYQNVLLTNDRQSTIAPIHTVIIVLSFNSILFLFLNISIHLYIYYSTTMYYNTLSLYCDSRFFKS